MTLVGAEVGGTAYASSVLTYSIDCQVITDKLLSAFIEALPLMRKTYGRLGFFPKIDIAPSILDKPDALGAADAGIKGIRGMWGPMRRSLLRPLKRQGPLNAYSSQRVVIGSHGVLLGLCILPSMKISQ